MSTVLHGRRQAERLCVWTAEQSIRELSHDRAITVQRQMQGEDTNVSGINQDLPGVS